MSRKALQGGRQVSWVPEEEVEGWAPEEGAPGRGPWSCALWQKHRGGELGRGGKLLPGLVLTEGVVWW